jgi:CHAD domain-containing protein
MSSRAIEEEDAASSTVVPAEAVLHPHELELLQRRTIDADLLEEEVKSAYAKARKTLLKRADGFVHDQSEENTHDIRTAIRRMDAALGLLPKKLRGSKKVKRVLKQHRMLLKESAAIRDMDVVRSRILKDRTPGVARQALLRAVEVTRAAHLTRAKDLAALVEKERAILPRRRKFAGQKLQRRFEKVVGKTVENIEKRLRVALSDPDDVEKLHHLRMDCKRLRYTLELVGATRYPGLISLLSSWQDALGSVVDAEVTIAFIKKETSRNDDAGNELLVESQAAKRAESFETFLTLNMKMPIFSNAPSSS